MYSTYRFAFDHVYGPDSAQEDVYNQSARSAVHSCLQVGRRQTAAVRSGRVHVSV